jgi:hypothetical protein
VLEDLDAPLYLEWLKRTKNIALRTGPHMYGSRNWQAMVRTTSGNVLNPVSLFITDFFEIIERKEYPFTTPSGFVIPTFPGDRLYIQSDTGSVKLKNSYNDRMRFSWRLPPLLVMAEYLVFDIVHSNFPKRQVFLSRKNKLFGDFYFGRESLRFPMSPDKGEIPNDQTARQIENLLKAYKPVLNTADSTFRYTAIALNDIHTRLYYEVTLGYLNSGKIDKAKSWSRNYLASFKNSNPVYSSHTGGMSIGLMRSGLNKEGITLLENVGEQLVAYQRQYRKAHPNLTSYMADNGYPGEVPTTESILKEYLDLVTLRKLDSKKLRQLITEAKAIK